MIKRKVETKKNKKLMGGKVIKISQKSGGWMVTYLIANAVRQAWPATGEEEQR